MTRLACFAFLAVLTTQVQVTDDDWAWFETSRERAFDALMPLAGHQGLFVAYRSYRDLYHDVPEQYFVISGGPAPEPFEAEVVVPIGDSVQQQLLDMHLQDRAASLETLLGRVRVQRLRLTDKACPAINTRWELLQRIDTPILPKDDFLVLHPMVHRIVASFLSGHADMLFYDDDHPVVRWSAETLTELRRCGQGS